MRFTVRHRTARAAPATIAPAGILVALGCFMVVALASNTYTVLHPPVSAGIDFTPLRNAAIAWTTGHSVFSDPTFVYPPAAALLGLPFRFGSASAMFVFWYGLQLAGLGLSVGLIARRVKAGAGRWLAVFAAAAVLLTSDPAAQSLALGNVSVFLVPVALLIVQAYADRRWRWGTALLVASLMVKPLLAPLLLLPAVRGRLRLSGLALMATVVSIAASAALMPGGGSLLTVLLRVARGSNLHHDYAVLNLSLPGLGEARGLPVSVTFGLRFVVIALAGLGLVRGCDGDDPAEPIRLAGVLLAATLLAGPLSEIHYLLPLAAIALTYLAQNGMRAGRRRVATFVPGLILIGLPFGFTQLLVPAAGFVQLRYLAAEALLLLAFAEPGLIAAGQRVRAVGFARRPVVSAEGC